MSLTLYFHPFASFCQKVLIALYENDIPFEFRMLSPEHPENMAELEAKWPFKLFPVLVDGERTVIETSIIIEHLGLYHPGPVQLIPEDPRAAMEVRFMDGCSTTTFRRPSRRSCSMRSARRKSAMLMGLSRRGKGSRQHIAGWTM